MSSGHNQVSYNPGPTPQYAYPTGFPPQGSNSYAPGDGPTVGNAGGFKVEGYDYNQRFEPKKRVRDPVFLLLFIAQVRHVPFR